MVIKAIPTEYNGYCFRSQLEARWAFFFDLLELPIPYIYELNGYKLKGGTLWYRPDFWLPDHDCFIEIKPYSPSKIELDKAYHLALEGETTVYIFCGDPYGLLEVHEYSFSCRYTLDFMLDFPAMPMEKYFKQSVEYVSENGFITYHSGDCLIYRIGPSYDALAKDNIKFQYKFEVGHKADRELLGPDSLDYFPEISSLVPELALEARMHQFWKPRNQ